MNRLKKYLYLICLLVVPAVVSAQNVQNVRVRQIGKTIEITYDLDEDAIIKVTGFSGSRPLTIKHLRGDVGAVEAGGKHKIVWDVLEDYKEFIFDNVTFSVSAKSIYSGIRTILTGQYGIGAIPQHSGGLMIGQIYKYVGWYADFRSSFCYKLPTNGYACTEGGGLLNVYWSPIPFYSGKRKTCHMLFTAGLLVDLTGYRWRKSSIALYAGAGYGYRYSLWETTEEQLILYMPTLYAGVSAKAGLVGNFKGVTLSAGVATINFQYMEVEFGVGYTINHKCKK